MSETNTVNVMQEGANMYGCLPCPSCHSVYRWPTQEMHPTDPSTILCDDCGFKEPIGHVVE